MVAAEYCLLKLGIVSAGNPDVVAVLTVLAMILARISLHWGYEGDLVQWWSVYTKNGS